MFTRAPRLMIGAVIAWLAGWPCWAQDGPRVVRPAGDGPHPAVLLISGCSGFVAFNGVNLYEERARELSEAGYLVVFVDYLGKRNLKNCAGTISHAQVGADVVEVAMWTRGQATVDANRVYAIGWSYGGGGLLAALAAQPAGDLTITKAVAIYPDCREVRAWKAATPTLILLGAIDEVTPPGRCDPVIGVAGVRPITYPDARHAFDLHSLPEKATYQFGTIGYNAEAARAMKAEIAAFLR